MTNGNNGAMTGFYDLILAAIAIERGSEVATFNSRHFAQIPGLKIIEPGGEILKSQRD
jgi:predicted nucleic acid-binding protein